MTMIQEEYVTFETARLLKDVGFHEVTVDYYYKGKFNADLGVMTNLWDDWNAQTDLDIVAAPFQSLALRWLREEKKLSVRLNYITEQRKWFADILDMERGSYFDETLCASTYEEACEDGIQAACKYIIEKGGEQ